MTKVAKSQNVNLFCACMRLLLGAKSVPFGCMSMARLGAKCAEVGCKVYGYFWVHVYAFWVHVYGSAGCMYAVVGYMYAVVGFFEHCKMLTK